MQGMIFHFQSSNEGAAAKKPMLKLASFATCGGSNFTRDVETVCDKSNQKKWNLSHEQVAKIGQLTLKMTIWDFKTRYFCS